MTDLQIEILDKLLPFFVENNGALYDSAIRQYLSDNNLNIGLINVVNVLVSYDLIRRNPINNTLKYLTPDGYKAADIGIKKYLQKKKFDDFIGGFWFKLFVFLIPTLISIIAVYINHSNKASHMEDYGKYYTKSQVDSLLKDSNQKMIKNYIFYDTINNIYQDSLKLKTQIRK